MNPKVMDIFAAIDSLSRTPTKVTITGTVSYPDWDGLNDHIQGIAPKNGTSETWGVLSGSSTDGGYIAAYQPSTVRGVSIWPNQPQDYQIVDAGGIQLWGTAKDPSGSSTNYSIDLYRYS